MTALALLPTPPIEIPPSAWPAMMCYTATVLLEAEGEPDPGQLAVAWVIRTRVLRHPRFPRDPAYAILSDVCLAARQFSCWDPESSGLRRARLTAIDPRRWEAAWRAASSAWWGFEPDPSNGAMNYLNVALTRAGRPLHDLPAWYDETKVVATIGKHEFLRLA